MPEARRADVAEIVKSAFERDLSERARYLDQACGLDIDLRAEVESLLNFGERAPRFLDEPAVHLAADLLADNETLQPDERLDQYEICSLIGIGGMGEVYLARDTALGRKVALKLVKSGFGTANIIRHFHQEERILAGLTHPNIARLYGGGSTRAGLPYFVMEHVAGLPIDEYCQKKNLSLGARLDLFRKVCAALQYAHQHLVIHRDLKPSNILVTENGEPKLLDFGIAKLLEEATAAVPLMVTAAGMMTPDYASPEQVRGENVTTASDVYGLGVLLYELLTGERPYRIKTRRPEEIARTIAGREVVRPSTAVRNRGSKKADGAPANSRSTNHEVRALRGDLDNIVLMALRKEPARRYSSAAQFSADIGRHLAGLPVIARKDTFQYRSGKFIKRHRVSVVAAVLVFLALLGGMATTIMEKRKAERRFNDVRELANALLFEVNTAIANLPGSTPARALLVRRALKYLTSLAQEAAGDRALQLELARAYLRVGDIQGGPYRANLGDTAGALLSYRAAETILETLSRTAPADLEIRYYLGLAHETIGRIHMRQAAWAEALQSERAALKTCEQLVAADPANPRYRKLMGDTYMQLGMAMQQDDSVLSVENFQQACEMFHRALSLHEALAAADPGEGEHHHAVGADYGSLGYTQRSIGDLTGDPKDYQSAVESHLKELEINQSLALSDPANLFYRDLAGVAHMDVGFSQLKLGQAVPALEHFRQYLSAAQSLVAADPSNVEAQNEVGNGYRFIGAALAQMGDIAGALENSRIALVSYVESNTANPSDAELRGVLINLHNQVGHILEEARDTAGALESYSQALTLLKGWLGLQPASAQVRRLMAREYTNIARVHERHAADANTTPSDRQQAWREARDASQHSLEIWHTMRAEGQFQAVDTGKVDGVNKDIARCDAALQE